MIRYKLTDQLLQTYNNTQWTLGEKKIASGEGYLCGPGWFHCYTHPLLAVFLNPIHAVFSNPRLFKAEVDGYCLTDRGLKEGWSEMTLLEEMELPKVTLEQRVAFAILCAKEICQDSAWNAWADRWLSGEDRSKESAWAARAETWAVAWAAQAAAQAAAWAAAWAAEAWAAEAETLAARATEATAEAEAWAAEATAEAETLAARATAEAAAVVYIDLIVLTKKAMNY